MTSMAGAYPFSLEVAPAAPQSRLTVFFRMLMIIPHYIVLVFLALAAGVVDFIAWWVILFTGRYPAGMLSFRTGVLRWQTNLGAYMLLLTGVYPPFSLSPEGYPVTLTGEGQVEGRNRLTTFWYIRAILTIPHVIVLAVIGIAVYVVVFIAWIVALITGSVPAGMHNFIAGFLRWSTRVNAYGANLTDQYPPFSMS